VTLSDWNMFLWQQKFIRYSSYEMWEGLGWC